MPDGKTEQIKLVMVFVLALVLALVVYVRFHQKEGASTSEAERPDRSAPFEVPEVAFGDAVKSGSHDVPGAPSVREPLRDIFAPGAGSAEREGGGCSGEEDSVSVAALRLRGVVAGGARPVALINDRFVRLGDRLYQYRVVNIGAKGVWLVSGTETFRLSVLRDKKDN